MCGNEISQLIGKLFGTCKRAKVLFGKFRTQYLFPGEFVNRSRIAESGWQSSLVNLFCKLKGLDTI